MTVRELIEELQKHDPERHVAVGASGGEWTIVNEVYDREISPGYISGPDRDDNVNLMDCVVLRGGW